MLVGQKLSPGQMELKEDRQEGLHVMCGDVLCTQNMCRKQGVTVQVCRSVPCPSARGAGGMRLLIVSIKASLGESARASLYFK